MEAQRSFPAHAVPLSFASTPNGPLKPPDTLQMTMMDIDASMSDQDRTQRAASVLSGMSAEDMEAAETLNSLHASR